MVIPIQIEQEATMDFDLNDEQRMWRQAVHDFCAKEVAPLAAEMDSSGKLDSDLLAKLAPLGLLGLTVAEAYGGSGVDSISTAIAIEELGWASGSLALSISAHNGLACAPIALFGSEEQKQRWLSILTSGDHGLGSLALTEPGGGSDLVGGVQTRAELDGDQWRINGSKAWITNAGLAPLIVTLCRTDSGGGSRSLSLIVVPTDTPGLAIHPAEKKMGVRGSPAHALSFEDVRVPKDNVLGEPGRGLYQTLEVLDGGRIGIGSLSVGLGRAALEVACAYARERQTFGKTLAVHAAIQTMIADAATQIEASRLMIYRAAWLKDSGLPYTREAAMGKLLATESAEKACRDAIQILGAYGYSSEYPVERFYRDARAMTIGEGTSEVQRMVIARRVLQLS
jgi:alkylation response protein AidB-like acyl-CoA dehydrogenase